MPYEREAIAESASANPSAPKIEFKEERVIDPYRSRSAKPTEPAPIGQLDTSGTTPPGPGSEAPKSPTEESVQLSPAAAALARKEQKFRQQEQALKEKEKALEAERAEIAQLKAIKAKLQAKDYSGIEELVKYDEYTNYLIEKEASSDPTSQELKKLQAKLEDVEKAQKSDVDKRFEAAVNERRRAVKELIAKDETYSSIKELKQEEAVVQHILNTWEQDNVDLTPEQAAKEVEEALIENARKWSALSKIKAKSEPAEKTLPPLKPGLKTLTNNVTAGEIKRPAKSFQGMSDSERWAEARRRAEEKLKKGS